MPRHELPTVIAQSGNARHDSLALHDRHPDDRAWLARKDVVANRSFEIVSDRLDCIEGNVPGGHQTPEQRRLGDRHRADHSGPAASRAGEANDVAGRIEVHQHDVRRVGVVTDGAEYRIGDLAFV